VDATTKATRHPAWAALAVLDALILAYLITRFPWGRNAPASGSSPLGELLVFLAYAVDIFVNLAAAAFVVAVAYAIAREIRGPWRPRWWVSLLATLALLAALGVAGFVAYRDFAEAFRPGAMVLPDRLVVFDRLAAQRPGSESIGARLAWLVFAAYLAEKYLLRWWNLRWPVSLVAIAIVAWPAWIAIRGEGDQDAWVASQQWKALAEKATWMRATSDCRALGAGWRLPRRNELALYLANTPEPSRKWSGNAWTMTTSELGANAVVVELAPRHAGSWRSNYTPWRDRSLCEIDALGAPPDAFAQLRPRLCDRSVSVEGLFVTTVQPIARIGGTRETVTGREYITTQTEAAAICINPSAPELPRYRRRIYPKEEEFADPDAFLARMKAVCNPRTGGSDAAACTAFGNYEPGTNASAGWVTK
jgi:hypothetical protein